MEITNIYELSQLLKEGERDFGKYGMVDVKYKDDLALFSYAAPCQFKRPPEWNYFERISRGLIMNVDTGEVVARPFDKFWNYGEVDIPADASVVEVTEKMDGSLGILYWHDDQPFIATRGSFDSDQAVWATDWFRNHMFLWAPGSDRYTTLFEIIYPENRIVVDYGGWSGLAILGARDRETGRELSIATLKDVMSNLSNWLCFPKLYSFSEVAAVLEARGKLSANEEGFVVLFNNGQRVKIKGDEYLQLHRFVSNFSFKNVAIAMRDDRIDDLRAVCPQMYREQMETWIYGINQKLTEVRTVVDLAFFDAQIHAGEESDPAYKKNFALFVQEHYSSYAHFLYAMRDGKFNQEMLFNRLFEL